MHYIGESERPLKIRIAEHKRPTNDKSTVSQHASKHNIDFDKVKILGRNKDWFGRVVTEAINIQRYGQSLNKDQGGYELSQVWKDLTCPSSNQGLESHDQPVV